MKKFILFLLIAVFSGTTISIFGQETTKSKLLQDELNKKERKLLYRAELVENMKGWRFGGEYSSKKLVLGGALPATKHGIHFNAGYRLSKRWYLGGIIGVDMTTPFDIVRDDYVDDDYNFSIPRKDKIYIPVMADVRYYLKVARISTYLYTNVGTEISNKINFGQMYGLGFDIHTIKSQCVNIKLGFGTSCYESANDDCLWDTKENGVGYGIYDGFAFNFKLGYSF